MIRLQVLTWVDFTDEAALDKYLASDEQARLTGFADEVREAWRSKSPFVFRTPRLQHGSVAKSEITVVELDDLGAAFKAMRRGRTIAESRLKDPRGKA